MGGLAKIKKYKTGLLIGRFQPFHLGHLYLIKKGLKNAENLVIGVGSVNVKNEFNPFTVKQRREMLEKVLTQENLKAHITKIIEIEDIPDDDEWVRRTLESAGEIDVIIGNNESGVNVFFEKQGYKILRFPYYKRELLEGTIIRKLLSSKEETWKDAVPSYLIKQIENIISRS